MTANEIQSTIMQHLKGAMTLQIAYIGVANNLFARIIEMQKAEPSELAKRYKLDTEYVTKWCIAAYAFGMLDKDESDYSVTEFGKAFIAGKSGSCMPMAAASVLFGHMAERAATFMETGEQPGEQVLWERESVSRVFGPMLEGMFGTLFTQQILPAIKEFSELEQKAGTVVDLGCGNGWFLNILASKLNGVQCIGLEGFPDNIEQAKAKAMEQAASSKLEFRVGDISNFTVEEPVDMITMNRAMHHVWTEKEKVFAIFKEHLKSDGAVIIWEPNWSGNIEDLRLPGKPPLAFQSLSEHIQGNHFLQPEEIVAEFHKIGMNARIEFFNNNNEAVIIARKS